MGNGLTLRFLTDEDVPRSTARILREAGFDATDVRDVGLRGKSDEEVIPSVSHRRNWKSSVARQVGN